MSWQYYLTGEFLAHAQSEFWEGVAPVIYFKIEDRIFEPYEIEAVIALTGELDKSNLGGIVAINFGSKATILRSFVGVLGKFTLEGTTLQTISLTDTSIQQYVYRVWVYPSLWTLGFDRQFNIAQQQSRADIAIGLLTTRAINTSSQITDTTAVCDTNTQYDESTLDYIVRLLQEDGVVAFFDYTDYIGDVDDSVVPILVEPNYTLVSDLESLDSFDLTFHGTRFGSFNLEQIIDFKLSTTSAFTTCSLYDYNFKTPETPVFGQATDEGSWMGTTYSIYPSNDQDSQSATDHATVVSSRETSRYTKFKALTTSFTAVAGKLVNISGSASDSINGQYFIERSTHTLEKTKSGWEYRNEITGVAFDADYFPSKTKEKPKVFGNQTAVVVGDSSNTEINVDSFGRVKLKFFWCPDTNDSSDYTNISNPSAWVRLMQWGTAGNGWGNICIPRVGQEVVVGFLNGDPDHPIVLGAVFNGINQSQCALPDHNCTTSIKSKTVGEAGKLGDRYNELKMVDTELDELLYLRAQHNANFEIFNDFTKFISGNDTTTNEGDVFNIIAGSRYERFGGSNILPGEVTGGAIIANAMLDGCADMLSIQRGVKLIHVDTGLFAAVVDTGDIMFTVPMGAFNIIVSIYSLITAGAASVTVGGIYTMKVAGDCTTAVVGAHTLSVTGACATNVTGVCSTNVEGAYSMSSEGALSISSAAALSIEAAAELNITAGSITIEAGDISITGASINMESGAVFSITAGAVVSVTGAMVQLN